MKVVWKFRFNKAQSFREQDFRRPLMPFHDPEAFDARTPFPTNDNVGQKPASYTMKRTPSKQSHLKYNQTYDLFKFL